MKYSRPELAAILEKELRQALGSSGSEIANLRLRNLQYYKAEPTGELAAPDIPDRSSIVSSDVADTVEWMLPSLLRPFVTSHEAVECEANKPEFEPQAKLASEYLRHLFWKKNNGFQFLYQWFKDALVQKVGFGKVWSEEVEEDAEETYRDLYPEQVEELLKDKNVTPIEQESYVVDIEGQPVEMYAVKVKRVEKKIKCRVAGCPPEEMRVHPRSRYGEPLLFIAQEFWRTKAELEADGYDLTGVQANDEWTQETIERADVQTPFFFDNSDGELTRYKCAECYIKLDQDKDGIPEWRKVFMIGSTVMDDDKVDDHPFVYFCPNPSPHVFFGDCPADFAIGPQRLNTSLLRATLDNVYLSVNKRMGVIEGQVNLDDLLNSRPGAVIRMKSPGALIPVEQNGLDESAWRMIEWGSQWREQRTGYTRYSQGLSPDALNPTATGVSIITEKADQRTELMAHVAAETAVAQMFTKLLKCASRYQDGAEMMHLGGQWISVDPREWNNAFNIAINVGLGTGSKDKKAMVLQQVLQIQQPMAMGGVLPPNAVLKAARDFAESAGLTAPESYFPEMPPPDPNKPPPPSPEQIKAQTELQKMQMQGQLEREKQAAQSEDAQKQAVQQAQLEQWKAQLAAEQDERRALQTAELDRWKAEQQALLERYKADLHAQVEREKAQMASLAQVDSAKASVAPATAQQSDISDVRDSIRMLAEHMNRPKTIIRDQNGRVAGVQ